MKIRKFISADRIKLSNLMRETVIKSNSKDYSKKAIKYLYDEYSPNNLLKDSEKNAVWVVEEKSELIGTISLVGNRISRMFVLPKYQGKGVGGKLLKHVEKYAKTAGNKFLRVRSSTTAFGFYQKMGFRKIRRSSNKALGTIIWMQKKFEAQ